MFADNSHDTIQATTESRMGRRRPKMYGSGRTCAEDDCNTRISRYNRGKYCYRHRPVHFPRVKGEDLRKEGADGTHQETT